MTAVAGSGRCGGQRPRRQVSLGMSAWAGQPGQVSLDKSPWSGQPGQVSQNREENQKGQVSQDNSAWADQSDMSAWTGQPLNLNISVNSQLNS